MKASLLLFCFLLLKITGLAQIADFNISPSATQCFDVNSFIFTDASYAFPTGASATGWFWDFGDGTSSALKSPPPKSYSSSGSFQVKLLITVSLSGGGLTARSVTKTVTVNPVPVITISPLNPVICSGAITNIVLTSSTGTGSSFVWTLGANTGGITGASAGNGVEGQFINQVLTNPSNAAAGSVVYSVTPTSPAGCQAPQPTDVTVTVNPVPVITISPLNPAICSGATTNIVLKSSTGNSNFVWTLGANTGSITGASAGNGLEGQLINQVLTNPSNAAAGSIVYSVTPTSPAGCQAPQPTDVTVTVNPVPVITISPLNPAICSGATTNIVLKSSTGSSSFVWTLGTNTGGITGAAVGNGSENQSINQVLTNPSNAAAGSVVYSVMPTSAGCPGPSADVTVTVNPVPVITTTPLNSVICSGVTTNIALTSSMGNSNFIWTLGTNTGGITGAFAGSGLENQLINQVLTNPSNAAAGSVVYSVIPISSATGCPGLSTNITVTVNPRPLVTTSPLNPVICSGATTNINLTSSTGTGSSFVWTLGTNTGGITGAVVGNGALINQVLTNPSNTTAGSIVYSVTPTSPAGCQGPPTNTVVTVNPVPVITISPLNPVICSGANTNIILKSSTGSSSFAWTLGANTGGITGGGAGSGSENQLINQALTNPNNAAAGSLTYVITPTSAGCPGPSANIAVTVNPAPTITITPLNPVICSGAITNIVLKSSMGNSSFIWTLGTNTGGITGASAGNGLENQLINQTLTNPSNATAGSVVYSVTPISSTAGCSGQPTNITVTVNPKPAITITPLSPVICSGATTNIILKSSTGSSSFAWTLGANVGGITGGAAGSGSENQSINQTLTNPSNAAAGSLTYVVTPTSAGCSGPPTNIAVTVNPAPTITITPLNPVICSGTTTNIVLKSSTGNSSFAWTLGTNVGGITGASAGNGLENQLINQTLTNPSNAVAGSITYIVTPTLPAGCSGPSTNITVTVNPKPAITITPLNPVICSGATTNIVLKSSTGNSNFVWTLGTNVGGITGASAGNGLENQLINQTLINPGPSTVGSIVYVVTPASAGCSGPPANIMVTVNFSPTSPPSITIAPKSPLCQFTNNQSFTATAPPGSTANDTKWGWQVITGTSIGKADVYDTSHSLTGNSIISFPNAGTVTVRAIDTVYSTKCTSYKDTVFTITATPSSDNANVFYYGQNLVCALNTPVSYQWGYDDAVTLASTTITGQTQQNYYIPALDTKTKSYWVISRFNNGCSTKNYYNKPVQLTGLIGTPPPDVTDNSNMEALSVFPNPVANRLTVYWKSVVQEDISFVITDITGKRLQTKTIQKAGVTGSIEFNVSNFSAGVYFISMFKNDRLSSVQKVVKY